MMIYLQHILPHQLLNKLANMLANCSITWWKNFLIFSFLKKYPVNLKEAINPDPYSYKNYNEFFTRKLLPTARIIDPDPKHIVSPCDGYISQYGVIKQNTLIGTKGVELSIDQLLASNSQPTNGSSKLDPASFNNGKFINIYLAPHNYHRIHMPITAQIIQMLYVPGKLFSVNPIIVNKLKSVFTKNERVIMFVDSDLGKVAIIAVGAMIVGSIVTNWHGQVTPAKHQQISSWDYQDQQLNLKKGDELGFFQLGSTVILLFANPKLQFCDNIHLDYSVKMGEKIAII